MMLRHRLIHPEILSALAAAGHGAKVLIADANYPSSTVVGDNAELVYLNLAPGKPTSTEVLDILLTAISVDDAIVMEPEEGREPQVFQEFRSLLPAIPLTGLSRFEFFEEAGGPETCLQIVTGDQRLYANILLTIGVIVP
jgi:L-fucose mutarotase